MAVDSAYSRFAVIFFSSFFFLIIPATIGVVNRKKSRAFKFAAFSIRFNRSRYIREIDSKGNLKFFSLCSLKEKIIFFFFIFENF